MTEAESWSRAEPEPTNLITLWPGETAPDESAVCDALCAAAGADAQRLGSVEPDDPDMVWTTGVRLPTLPRPVTIWAEPARALGANDLDDPAAAACPWAIGLETVFDEDDPLSNFATLMKLIGTAWPEATGVLDVNTASWHPRVVLDGIFVNAPTEPPADVLWTIHSVEHEETSTIWLHTHGLWRCGRPELEMLRVPIARIDAHAVLLNELAALLLDEDVPWLGEPWEVGRDLNVVLQAWETVAETLDDDEPGSVADREATEPEAHAGYRVAVCNCEPVVDALVSGSGLLFRTSRATIRQATLARATWDDLARARDALDEAAVPETRALVQATGDADGQDDAAEHSWYEIVTIDGDVITGRLLNQPTRGTAKRGDTCRVDRADVSDWQVITPAGSFDPDSVDEMAVAVGQLTEETS